MACYGDTVGAFGAVRIRGGRGLDADGGEFPSLCSWPVPADLIGDPLWAVLIPPRLERFRELTGLGEAALTADFTGWNKYVLLAGDRVFLFPREPANLEWFGHELAVYRALTAGGFALAPQVRGQWRDEEVYPFPFAEVTRLTGGRPDDLAALFGPLGAVLARIHQVPPPDLPWPRRIARHQRPAYRWLHRALDPATSADAAAEAARRLDRPGQLSLWRRRLGVAAGHGHVLVHGDIHEHQVLVTERRDHRDPGLGDGPGRSPVLGLRSGRVGHRAVAPATSRVLQAVGHGLAGVRGGARNRPGPSAAGDGVPAAPGLDSAG